MRNTCEWGGVACNKRRLGFEIFLVVNEIKKIEVIMKRLLMVLVAIFMLGGGLLAMPGEKRLTRSQGAAEFTGDEDIIQNPRALKRGRPGVRAPEIVREEVAVIGVPSPAVAAAVGEDEEPVVVVPAPAASAGQPELSIVADVWNYSSRGELPQAFLDLYNQWPHSEELCSGPIAESSGPIAESSSPMAAGGAGRSPLKEASKGTFNFNVFIRKSRRFLSSEDLESLSLVDKTLNEFLRESCKSLRLKVGCTPQSMIGLVVRRPKLKKLDLFHCVGVATGFIDLPAGSLAYLEELNLTMTGLTTAQVRAIANLCPNLKKLDIGNTPVGAFFAGLIDRDFAQLHGLKFDYQNIDTDVLVNLGRCFPKLKELTCLEAEVTPGPGVVSLPEGWLASLEVLNLDGAKTNAALVFEIGRRCLNLKKLNISEHLDPRGWFLPDLPPTSLLQIEELILDDLNLDTQGVVADGLVGAQVAFILNRCTKIKKLSIKNCYNQPGAGFIGQPKNRFACLQELNLEASNVNADEVVAIGSCCPKLKRLNLRDNSGSAAGFLTLNDARNYALAHHLPVLSPFEELKVLSLQGDEALNQEQVCAIANLCPNLQELSLHGVEGAFDMILPQLEDPTKFPQLTLLVVGIDQEHNLDEIVERFHELRPDLRIQSNEQELF
jgi:hypothetical protein